jgi:predicted ATPase/DNA-binding SARP family transcriptional activator
VDRGAEFLLNAVYTRGDFDVVAPLEFRILGALEVSRDGCAIALGTVKQRALLAVLLLHRNEIVPIDRLVEELWPRDRPATARNNVEVYVSRLRRVLGADVLVTRAPGYVLRVEPEQLDASRFEGALASARAATNPGRTSDLLTDALALWRGPALADFVYDSFAEGETSRLEELRLQAVEERLEARLALSDGAELVPELELLVADNPFRERLRAQLMLALYRCGRQTDALAHYRDAVHVFAEELGVMPGPELQVLERRILTHDPSLRVRRLAPENVPAPPDRLIGRLRELDELQALFADPNRRLVTLTGTGGSGKTRLALEVARRLREELDRPSFFVELAPVSDPALVLGAVARVLGVEETPGASACETIAEFLSGRWLLLVLDNFEHLPEAAVDVAALLAEAPGLNVLVTSRSRLRIRGEWCYELRPLPIEDAVCLFLERARAAGRSFAASPVVEEICRRLDALPLAIEVAAARADLLAPETILAQLDDRLGALVDGPRDLPLRQQTLRATIDWSYDLLDAGERDAFVRLGVFAGGGTAEAVSVVCDATTELVASLCEKSLVRRDGDRIVMLETIREYALERLGDSGDENAVRDRHARYFLRLAERGSRDVEAREWASPAELGAEHDNLRAALSWSREGGAVDLHLGLVTALAPFWDVGGYLSEGDAWLQEASVIAEREAHPLRASILVGASGLAARLGDLARAAELAKRALRLYRDCDDTQGTMRVLHAQALIAAWSGEEARAASFYAEERAIATRAGARRQEAVANIALGANAARRGDYAQARALLEDALAVLRGLGDDLQVGQAQCILGMAAVLERDYAAAREPLERSLEIARRFGYREAAAYSLTGLAGMAADEGDLARAEHLLAAADVLFDEVGAKRLPLVAEVDGRTRSAVLAARGPESFEAARERMRNTSHEEIVAVALRTPVTRPDNFAESGSLRPNHNGQRT